MLLVRRSGCQYLRISNLAPTTVLKCCLLDGIFAEQPSMSSFHFYVGRSNTGMRAVFKDWQIQFCMRFSNMESQSGWT